MLFIERAIVLALPPRSIAGFGQPRGHWLAPCARTHNQSRSISVDRSSRYYLGRRLIRRLFRSHARAAPGRMVRRLGRTRERAVITYFSLVIGELVPKQIALRDPEKIAVRVAPVMTAMCIAVLCWPQSLRVVQRCCC